ncbi:molybdopterin-synthase adenylyltransferase MoeB [Carboxylicivirga linearis]|uniref:Molybdopterin-synthase adenylyltransferase MoeB n=1 Tax=Carboxylicivirga linearis TaxID=1628157 RepID=A0ABS5JSY9_9BACT|nr:molybdopterin-synthase adenylyltransferase MoeB [Carboxylicivirga linearis]MBS2097496.1 molybdopterin-synthase adenylyltransferase MoeB [Carboxylicivirga linearis]
MKQQIFIFDHLNSQINMHLTKEELERYKRHTILPMIGVEGQKKLKHAKVLIVGTGGLGSPLSMYLTASGVGTLGLVDFDTVDASNLQRQIVHKSSNVGRLKTESALESLKEINPFVNFQIYNDALTTDNAIEIISQYDYVCDGTDNFKTRYLVNDACVLAGKINVFGSIHQFEGQVSVFGTQQGPCYRCLFPDPPSPGTVPSCAEAGVMGVLPGVIGTIQATEVIKQICGIGQPLVGRLLNYNALNMQFNEVKFIKDHDCPCCGKNPTITKLSSYNEFCDVSTKFIEEEISASELKQMILQNNVPVMIDVREAEEVANSKIEGSVHIPMAQIPDRQNEIPKNVPVVIYCHLGIRSKHVIQFLQQQGFTNLINLTGGIDSFN